MTNKQNNTINNVKGFVMLNCSAKIVVKFSTAAGGSWIEQDETPLGTTRVWRFVKGCAEWSDLKDHQSGNPAVRWYSHQFKEKDFIFC